MGDNFEGPIKSAQGENFENFFSEFFKKFLKFPKYILGIRSRSEIDLLEKNVRKSRELRDPPPVYLHAWYSLWKFHFFHVKFTAENGNKNLKFPKSKRSMLRLVCDFLKI